MKLLVIHRVYLVMPQGSQTLFRTCHPAKAVCWKKCVQPNMTQWQRFFIENNPVLTLLNVSLLHLLQNSAQAQWITVLLSVSSSLGPSIAIHTFHWCLVSSWLVAGAHRFLAGLFTILSRWPVVCWLRASGRNWWRTIIMTGGETSQFSALHCLSCHAEL